MWSVRRTRAAVAWSRRRRRAGAAARCRSSDSSGQHSNDLPLTGTERLGSSPARVITTATLRDATGWDDLVRDIGQPGLVRHGLRHTALTWMAEAGVELHILQRVAGHHDAAVTSRYLHPDVQAMLNAGAAFSAWWSPSGPQRPNLAVVRRARDGHERGA
jgi:integrase